MSAEPSPEATQTLDSYVRVLVDYLHERNPEREIPLEESAREHRLRIGRVIDASLKVSTTRGMTDGSHDRARDELDDALEKL